MDYTNCAVICAGGSGVPAEDQVRHGALRSELERYGLKFNEARITRDKVDAPCFVVAADHPSDVRYVIQLGRAFEQESILVTYHRVAVQTYMDGFTRILGEIFRRDDFSVGVDFERISLGDGTVLVVLQ